MASVQLDKGKHTTKQATAGNIKHDFRERDNYANKEIDKSLSHLNQCFGCTSGAEARKKLLERIAECDAAKPPKRIKKDRKTSLEVHIPAPREMLDNDKLRLFFAKSYAALEDEFGKDNVIYGVTHFDEVHEYLDPHDGKLHSSREGMHVVVIPWSEKKGLNMNEFYKRSLPTRINKVLDKVCLDIYGFSYQDGTKKSNQASVEELKASSAQIDGELATKIHDMEFYDFCITDKKRESDELDRAIEIKKKECSKLDDKSKQLDKREEMLVEKEKIVDTLLANIKVELNNWNVKKDEELKREKKKMKESFKKFKLKWMSAQAEYIKNILEKSLHNQVKDIEKFRTWQAEQRAAEAVSDIVYDSSQKELEM